VVNPTRAATLASSVNFLSHDYILPEQSAKLTRLGSALPDLWSVLGRRPLPLVVQRRLEQSSDPDATALVRGIRSHLVADAVFHGHATFRDRIAWLTPQLAPAWDGLRHASLAAHVLVEMVLDGWIVARQPERLDTYYACFTPDRIDTAARLSADDGEMEAGVSAVIHRFATVQFLRDYDTPEGTTDRFVRLLTHTPFASGTRPNEGQIIRLVEQASRRFENGSSELLDEVRTASDDALA